MLNETGDIKIIDFGIAQMLTDETSIQMPLKPRIIGTPIYMSPEQRSNPESVSYPSDIYSLGIIAYELILGKLSHGRIHLSLLPKGLQKILSKALQPDPEKRYQDVVDLITALSAYMNSASLEKEKKSSDQLSEMAEHLQEAQMALFPLKEPSWDRFEIGISCNKGAKLAGIYYDFITYNDDHYGVVLGETTSSGAEGIVYTAVLRGIVRTLAAQSPDHDTFLHRLNEQLIKDPIKQMFPFSMLTLSKDAKELNYSSCSYGSLWKVNAKDNTVSPIQSENAALGVEVPEEIGSVKMELKQGDILVVSSLPYTEASEGQFPTELFRETLEGVVDAPPQRIVEVLFRKAKMSSRTWLETHSLTIIAIKIV